jgi:ABC-type antimicrobial peptide transport system permease subunit
VKELHATQADEQVVGHQPEANMPDWTREIRQRLSSLGLSPTREAEIVEELSQHLDDRWRELMAGGASSDEATQLTLAEFTGANRLVRHMATLNQAHVPPSITPRAPGGQLLGDLSRDVRYAVRTTAARPGFTAVAVLSLAFGIGANTAISSLLDAVLLRPMPVSHSEQIVSVYTSDFSSTTYGSSSYPDYLDFLQRGSGVMDIAAYRFSQVSMNAGADTEMAFAETVSGNYFPLLGIRATVGRLLGADDDRRNSRVHPDLGGPVARFIAVLMAVVGLVLLTACANVANLLLARGTARAREIGVRLALGANRGRLVRQLLSESVMLASLGGVFGLLVAVWLMQVLGTFKPPVPVPLVLDLRLAPSVLTFTAVLSVSTGLLFGLAPALHASRSDVVPILKDDSSTGRRRPSRLRSAFVVAQVTCSTLLLIGAGLFIQSLQQARAIDVGFDPSHLVVMSLNPALQGYDQRRGRALYDRVLATVGAVPGVSSASLAANVPLGLGVSRRVTVIDGYRRQPGEDTETAYNVVGPRYFDTLRIALLRGRSFTEADGPDASPVVIVNDAFARRYWPNGDSLWQRLSANGSQGPFREIIGVVRTGKYDTLGEEPRPFYYLPLLQEYQGAVVLHVRTNTDSRALIAPVRDAIRSVDAAVPVFDAKTMEDQMLIALLPARLAGTLLGAFGMLALLLAAIGIYGVMAYSVAQRTREIGVRMALGAGARELLALIIGEGARLTGIGLAIGITAALGLTRFISSLLYGIQPADVVSFAGATFVLTASAIVACYIPARRAIRVDPVVALRHE